MVINYILLSFDKATLTFGTYHIQFPLRRSTGSRKCLIIRVNDIILCFYMHIYLTKLESILQTMTFFWLKS